MKTPAANVTQINNVITLVFKADPYLPCFGTSSLQRFPSTSTSRSKADICLQKILCLTAELAKKTCLLEKPSYTPLRAPLCLSHLNLFSLLYLTCPLSTNH